MAWEVTLAGRHWGIPFQSPVPELTARPLQLSQRPSWGTWRKGESQSATQRSQWGRERRASSASQRLTPPVGLSPPEGYPSCSLALRTYSGDTKSPNGVMQVEGGRALAGESGGLTQTLRATRWMTLGPQGSQGTPSVGLRPPICPSVCADMLLRGWAGRHEWWSNLGPDLLAMLLQRTTPLGASVYSLKIKCLLHRVVVRITHEACKAVSSVSGT